MSVITKDLGIATAYGYAKAKGYTGTEEEFAQLMASYATVAEEAAESAEAAEQSATNAADSAQAATTKAGEASESAGQASTSAENAATSANSAGASETNAARSASAASQSASDAVQSAQAASGSAANAAGSATTAVSAKEAVQNMGVASETLTPGSQATVEKSVDAQGAVTLTFGIPKGEKGDTGDVSQAQLTEALATKQDTLTMDANGIIHF